jgi:hypothetical protein
MIEEATESPGFWILGGVGTACVLVGWIMSKKAGMASLPIWEVIVMIITIWIASLFFAGRE